MSASQQDIELEQAKLAWELAREAVVLSNVNLGHLVHSQFDLIKSLILVQGITYSEALSVFQQMLDGNRKEQADLFRHMVAMSDAYGEALRKAGKFPQK